MPEIKPGISSRKMRYFELDALRGFAILIVYFHHWDFEGGPVLFSAGGKTMVCFFSILSGFVLCAAFGRRIGNGSLGYGKFLFGRLGKIWPLATLVSVFAFAVMYYHHEPGWELHMIGQIFMVSAWVPDSKFYFAGNMPSWFLSGLMLFYVLFPLLFRWMHRSCRSFISVTSMLVLLSVILSCMPGLDQDPEAEYWFYLFPPMRLLDCMTGMCIWKIIDMDKCMSWAGKPAALRPGWVSLAWFLWLVLYATVCVTASDIVRGLYYTLTSLLAGALLLWLAVIFRNGRSVVMRVLRSRPLQWLGSVSFCIYLIHWPIIVYAESFNITRGWNLDQYVLSAMTLVFVVLFAWLIDNLFVRPLSRYIDRRLNFRRDTAPVL